MEYLILPIFVIGVVLIISGFKDSKKDRRELKKELERYRENKRKLNSIMISEGFQAEKTIIFKSVHETRLFIGVIRELQVQFDFKNDLLMYFENVEGKLRKYNLSTIIGCELLQDNSTIMNGGIGRAVVGAAIAGGFGAMVGAGTRGSIDVVNNLAIRIITNEPTNAMALIELYRGQIKRNSEGYAELINKAQDLYSTIYSAVEKNKKADQGVIVDHNDISEQIRKFARLRDDGLITDLEYEKKKKQLLGIED